MVASFQIWPPWSWSLSSFKQPLMPTVGRYVYCSEENILGWSLEMSCKVKLNKVPAKSAWLGGTAGAKLRVLRAWGV